MTDSTTLEAEIDILNEEMKFWEQGMAYEWTEGDRCSYLERKRDTIKNFFMNEVAAAEKKGASEASTSSPTVDVSKDSEAAKAAEEAAARAEEAAARAAAEEAAARAAAEEAAARAEEAAARAAAEEAAIEAEVRRQIEEEERQKAEAELALEEAEAAAKVKIAAERAAAEKVKIASAAASPSASPSVPPMSAQALADLENELNAALEKELKEAQLRITRTPVGRQADLTDPAVVATYIRIRNDRDDLNWMMLGYPDNNLPNKITVTGCGSGGWKEMIPTIPEEPVYLYINYKFGDTGRSKFVFMTYVPDTLSGMKKSRVLGHRPQVEKLLKYMQLSWHILEHSEFSEETLQKKLLAAGGANYSVQEADKGDFSSYKKTTREFYTETERKGTVSAIVYQTGPLTTTPMDISGRSMVASQSDFRGNLVDLK